MPAAALALALGAAGIHALWNTLLARARDTEAATALALLVAMVAALPAVVPTWRVHADAIPYFVATNAVEIVFFVLLGAAYARSELSLVYPLARGLAPVSVLFFGAVALGYGVTAWEVGGVCLVAVGVVLVRGLRGHADARGVAFAVAIAISIAGYTLIDRLGIRHANAISYLELALVGPALVYPPLVAARRGVQALRAELRWETLVIAVGMFGGYLLVLAALRLASAASVAAVRETSVLLATALAAAVLRERVSPSRALGSALVVGGIALLALG